MAVVNRYSRDNARTPMQWDDSSNAGFTTGTPWLPVNPNFRNLNLAEQRRRPDSVYYFYRKLIALRKSPHYAETVVYGMTEPYLPERENLMAYFRRGDKTLLVLGNTCGEKQTVSLPGRVKDVLINNLEEYAMTGQTLDLAPWQFLILEMEA